MALGGIYEFVVNSPMGEQGGTFTVVPDASGMSFAGTLEGAMGSAEASEGMIAGNTLTWKMSISAPMPMSLECEAHVEGDEVTGKISAGIFGSMPLTGKKIAELPAA